MCVVDPPIWATSRAARAAAADVEAVVLDHPGERAGRRTSQPGTVSGRALDAGYVVLAKVVEQAHFGLPKGAAPQFGAKETPRRRQQVDMEPRLDRRGM